MITKIYLTRHGKSEANNLGIVQGRGFDVPITEEGIKQSKQLAKWLKNFSFDVIFTATAVRAKKTAEIIKKYHPSTPLIEVYELYERSKGEAEGMLKTEYNKRYPKIIKEWSQEIDARPVGGENYEDVEKRIVPIFLKHLNYYQGKTLLYVGHGNVMKVFLGYILKIPFDLRHRLRQDYCSLDSLIYDHEKKRWEIKYINLNPKQLQIK